MNNNMWGWVTGIGVIVLIILGIWWYAGSAPGGPGGVATTTPEAANTNGTTNTAGGTPVSSESRSSSSVAAVVASLATGNTFDSYFISTGVASSLTGKGPYTVFVPTNEAFARLSAGTISTLAAAQKKRLVQYHVVSGKALDIDAVSSGTYTALSKDALNFRVDPVYKQAFVNSGYAITQYRASNGIVYVISEVLIPPQTPDASTGSTGSPTP